jgi:hypothetical protein
MVTDTTGLTNTQTVNFSVAYTLPAAVDFTVDPSGYDTIGYAAVIWYSNMLTAAQSAPLTVSNPGGGTAQVTIGTIPVAAGSTYTGLALLQPNTGVTARNAAVAIEWRDAFNTTISTSLSASLLETGGSTIQLAVTALAPPGAAAANLIIQVFGTASSEIHQMTQPQFYTGGYTTATAPVDGNFVAWRVYRKAATDLNYTLVYETPDPNVVQFQDSSAPATIPIQYQVAQVATRFGVSVESVYAPLTLTIDAAAYWLIHPTDSSLSVKLVNVTADQFSNEVERAIIKLIGRGRRVEYGTDFGKTGSLTALIRDTSDLTGAEQFAAIDALKVSASWVNLRNPFGQVWSVGLGDVSINRLPGVGSREFGDLTIPYDEITST